MTASGDLDRAITLLRAARELAVHHRALADGIERGDIPALVRVVQLLCPRGGRALAADALGVSVHRVDQLAQTGRAFDSGAPGCPSWYIPGDAPVLPTTDYRIGT